MRQVLDAPVSVILSCDSAGTATPLRLKWDGRAHQIVKVGLHHTFRRGRVLVHVYSVVTDVSFYRLELDSEALTWRLTEIHDGLPD